MVLNKQYVKGEIIKVNNHAYMLKVTWCWYYVLNYEECHVFNTLQEAKDKFLSLRGDGRFVVSEDKNS